MGRGNPVRVSLLLMLISFITGSQCERYIGCYKDNYLDKILLSGIGNDFPTTLTPYICTNYCKSKEYGYAGLRDGYQCYCSNERPSFKHFADPLECNSNCDGNKSQKCGGGHSSSVYDVQDRPVNYISSNYEGCYGKNSLNNTKASLESENMTPELCAGQCFSKGYLFAAVENKQCFCGDVIKSEKVSDSQCNQKCVGNPNLICGGEERSSAYHTSISDEGAGERYLGCYIDSPIRIIDKYVTDLTETNNPKRCMNLCKALGYQYAGLEARIECFCGNAAAGYQRRRTNDGECNLTCPNDAYKSCGGWGWRMSIYSTPSQNYNWITQMFNVSWF